MKEHTNPQIITQNGKPAFAVIPWKEYQTFIKAQQEKGEEAEVWFPNEVVKANVRGDSLIKAWRQHLGFTQVKLAEKIGMKQSALARLEKSDINPRQPTLAKLAKAMNLSIDQLIE